MKKRAVKGNIFSSWKITDDDLKNQVADYSTLKITASYRGQSVLALVLVLAINLAVSIINEPRSTENILYGLIIYIPLLIFAYRGNRRASVAIMILLTTETVIIISRGTYIVPIFTWLFVMPFFYKALKVENERRKLGRICKRSISKGSAILLGTLSVVIVAIIGYSLLSVFGVVPTTRVQSGDEVNDLTVQLLRSKRVILQDDEIKFFYAHGPFSLLESGNILTQDRVILYLTDKRQELKVYEIYFDEITEVELEQPGSLFSDSVYVVRTGTPDRWIKLSLSNERKGDEAFVAALRQNIESNNPDEFERLKKERDERQDAKSPSDLREMPKDDHDPKLLKLLDELEQIRRKVR